MIELVIGYAAGAASAIVVGLVGALHLRRRYYRAAADAGVAIRSAGKAMRGSIDAERERRTGGRTAGKGWSRDG